MNSKIAFVEINNSVLRSTFDFRLTLFKFLYRLFPACLTSPIGQPTLSSNAEARPPCCWRRYAGFSTCRCKQKTKINF